MFKNSIQEDISCHCYFESSGLYSIIDICISLISLIGLA